MQLAGVKGLQRTGMLTEQGLANLEKKLEQFRKYTKGSFDYFEYLAKNCESFCISFEKNLLQFTGGGDDALRNMAYYSQLTTTFGKCLEEQKAFADSLINEFKEDYLANTQKYTIQTNLTTDLEHKVRAFMGNQQNLAESNRRFYKLYKIMLGNIDLYKESFTDVKLIYNRNQKLRRYALCESNYQELMQERTTCCQLAQTLTNERAEIAKVYRQLVERVRANIQDVGDKINIFERFYVKNYCQLQCKIMNATDEAINKISTLKMDFCLVSSYLQSQEKKYLKEQVKLEQHPFIPSVIINYRNIMDTHYPHIGIFLIHLEKELAQIYRKRKHMDRQFFEFISNFQRDYEKLFDNFKDFIGGFEKKKKRSLQFYGSKSNIFMKTFNSIFQIILPSSQKVWKHMNLKIKNIDLLLGEESKIMDAMFKQFKVQLEKFMMKKETPKSKKSFFDRKKHDKMGDKFSNDLGTIKNECLIKLDGLKVLFAEVYERIQKNCEEIKVNYDSIIQIMEKTAIEDYANIKERLEESVQSVRNLDPKEIETSIVETINSRTHFLQDSSFGFLLTEGSTKIIFEPELNKIEQFNKLKRPVELQDKVKEFNVDYSPQVTKGMPMRDDSSGDQTQTIRNSEFCVNNDRDKDFQSEKLQEKNKHQTYLLSRVTLHPDQKYIKSYVCGLADKIILSGRMYITNKRLCFFSKFNPKNVFFGETFIEIPKEDIKKIQKRTNAIFFDNSISITTVNGQIFFTSFFSRNQAYDRICSALEVVYDEMYVQQKIEEAQVKEDIHVEQDDDLKEEDIPERANKIHGLIKTEEYKQIDSLQFTFKGLTALKFFKLFETNNEINYCRAKHKGFSGYLKYLLGHSQMEIQDWSPNVSEYLNSRNIKNSMPLEFTRKCESTVPVPPSGIPFMPKSTRATQHAILYLFSKDKYVIWSKISNKGVPYCDDFEIHYKREVETIGEDKISFKMYFHIHFFNKIMVANMIEGKSFEQSKGFVKKQEEEINKYFKHLNKLQEKKVEGGSGLKGNQADVSQLKEQIQEIQGEVEDLKKEKAVIKASLETEQSKADKFKFGLLLSAILNLVLLLILFS